MTGDRRQRHLKILEIISTHAIHTQEELADALAREGWDVTQSSVSRDIAALHLVKVDGAYQRPAFPPAAPRSRRAAGKECSLRSSGEALVAMHSPARASQRRRRAHCLAWPDAAISPATIRFSSREEPRFQGASWRRCAAGDLR